MPNTLHCIFNSLLVDNISSPEFNFCIKPFCNQAFQYFQLHFPHDLHLDLLKLLIPNNMKFRFFLLKLPQFWEHYSSTHSFRQYDLISKHRFQRRLIPGILDTKPISRTGIRKPCDRTDHSCLCFLRRLIFFSGINPDLTDLFLFGFLYQRRSYFQHTSCDF